MFDLFRSRAKAVRIMLGGMLAIVALSMLVYLIPGAGTSTGTTSDDQVVAEIGKESVTIPEVEQQINTVLQNRQLPRNMVDSYIPQLIDQAISDRAVAYQAQQLGFQVSDADLAKVLRSFQFGSLPPDQYRQYIEQQLNMTVQSFETNVRLNSYSDALNNIAMEGVIITPADAEAEWRYANEKIKMDYIGFDPAKLSATVKPSPEEVKTYFDHNKNTFTIPETRSLQFVIADQAMISATIPVSDAQLESYYNSHKDEFRTAERVQARHILLSTANKPKDEVPKIQAKAEALLKQIKAGGDFAELAKKNSEDPTSAVKGGDLGWVLRGQMVPNFEKAVFALQPKEISNVVSTEYGFHIVQVMAKEPAHLKTVEEAKNQIMVAIRNETVFDKMQSLTDEARAELAKSPNSGQEVANKLHLMFAKVDKYAPGGLIPELGADPQIGAAVMSLKPGEVSQVLQSGTRLAVAAMVALNPQHPAEFSEVANQVAQVIAQQNAVQTMNEKTRKAADLLKQNGGDLKAVAKTLGLEVKDTGFFSRNGAAEGIGSGGLLGDSFSKPVGTIVGPMSAGGQYFVGKITERQPLDMSKFAADRDALVTQMKGRAATDRRLLLQDSIVSTLVQQGKVKKHPAVINRLMARYRT